MDKLVKMILFSLIGSGLMKDGSSLIVNCDDTHKSQFISQDVVDSSAATSTIYVCVALPAKLALVMRSTQRCRVCTLE
jgi:hypothetical protein